MINVSRRIMSNKFCSKIWPWRPWLDAGLALTSEATLTGQDRGKDWEYRVIAVNKAGESEPSNMVVAVL